MGQREQLIGLGSEALADALLRLATRNLSAEESITWLLSSSDESVSRIRKRIRNIEKTNCYITWHESSDFADRLCDILDEIETSLREPKAAIELLEEFFQLEHSLIENCDDSEGEIFEVFSDQACDLYIHFAAQVGDKIWLIERLIAFLADTEYDSRSSIVDRAEEYLSEEAMRQWVDRLWERCKIEQDDYLWHEWISAIKSLARQLKEPALFERACLDTCDTPNASMCLDIAKVHYESGNAVSALAWMDRAPNDLRYEKLAFDKFLLQLLQLNGERGRQPEVAWRIFRQRRDPETLEILLEVIGKDRREEVLREQARQILGVEKLSLSDATFLIESGCLDDAERYLLARQKEINGAYYSTLVPMAEAFENGGRLLVASMLYRALLDSVLDRGYTKAYHHGADYLRKLDQLAAQILEWGVLQPHKDYYGDIRKQHGRKYTFWPQYAK